MAQLLKQAQQMQQQLVAAQEELAQREVTGSAGGGLVTATMTGSGDVTAITIAPSAVDPDDLETLQDLVVAALHDAKRAADELAAVHHGPARRRPGWRSRWRPRPPRLLTGTRGTPCTRVPSRT